MTKVTAVRAAPEEYVDYVRQMTGVVIKTMISENAKESAFLMSGPQVKQAAQHLIKVLKRGPVIKTVGERSDMCWKVGENNHITLVIGGTYGGQIVVSNALVSSLDFMPHTASLKIDAATRLVEAEKWSQDVTENVEHHTPEGLFSEGTADAIARDLKKEHGDDFKGAMSALNFYLNRAGENLEDADKKRIEGAKDKLRKLYGKEESE